MSEKLPVNDIANWHVQDAFPESQLINILPLSARAISLIARKRNAQILSESFLQVFGSAEIMQGMDYHYAQFMETVRSLCSLEPLSDEALRNEARLNHEAVAYVNRLGQFYYFAMSDFVRHRFSDTEQLIPKISELKIFRMKYSAHRSIDKPWAEDSPHLQTVHAMSFSTMGGKYFLPKEPCHSADPRVLYAKCYRGYQLNMGSGGCWDLVIERDHSACMSEAYSILERLLN